MSRTQRVEDLWGHLHYLVVLAEKGSFSRAADSLGVSKAGMSQRITDLERAVGVPLVRRTTRSVSLTEEGLALVGQTQQPFAQIAQAFSAARDAEGPPRGLVRVTAPVAFARLRMLPLMPAFLEAFPGIKVEIDLSDGIRSLALEGYDVAIRHTDNPPQTHVALRLCEIEFYLVASADYLRQRGTPEHPSSLANHNCLNYTRGRDRVVWQFECMRGDMLEQVGVQVTGSFASNSSEAQRDAAMAGLGIARLPDFNAGEGLRSGRLVRVLPEWKATSGMGDHLIVLRSYTSHVPKASAAFVNWLRAALRS
ncbi:LysR family transcriptional regulator [Hydrogenophaga sp.]|uniref:LysR family transcriptional regulator n=1 Tax=Hydrogenophaga sp. TaxID=1904254 RepID=UPI003F70D086